MSAEPNPHASRFGLILTVVAVGGSAVGVVGWHLFSNRSGAGLDTSGFDMSSAPDSRPSRPAPAPPPAAAAAPVQNSLGMVKGDAGIRVAAAGSSAQTPQAKPAGAAGEVNPKETAVMNFKDAAAKNERLVDAYVRRMQAKYPSIGQYGKDWVKHKDLVALRDQYWKDHDPLKFAYGLAKADGFGQLVKKYATDPGIRATLLGGLKEAPPTLLAAAGGVISNDKVVKDLFNTVMKATGLPPSVIPLVDGTDAKPPDANNVLKDIMSSPDVQKSMQNQQAPVSVDSNGEKPKEPEPTNNGFTPLGTRR